MILYVVISCMLNTDRAPLDKDTAEQPALRGKEKLRIARDGLFSMVLIVAVLGSIITGIATPTESGAIGVVGAIFLAIIFKRFKRSFNSY